jgi:hypothetical protein
MFQYVADGFLKRRFCGLRVLNRGRPLGRFPLMRLQPAPVRQDGWRF